MYAQMDFDPAEVPEDELFGLDFIYDLSRLAPDEQLLSATFSIGIISGVDATPAARLVGSPYVSINPFNKTGLATMAVQRIVGLQQGVFYWVQADVVTTNANKLSLWSRIPPENPPTIWSPQR